MKFPQFLPEINLFHKYPEIFANDWRKILRKLEKNYEILEKN